MIPYIAATQKSDGRPRPSTPVAHGLAIPSTN
jgi:hypothetical protein